VWNSDVKIHKRKLDDYASATNLPMLFPVCIHPERRVLIKRNGAKVTLRERGLCVILCNSERVLNVIHSVPGLPKSEFCAIGAPIKTGKVL
jgi:hypothetical protein